MRRGTDLLTIFMNSDKAVNRLMDRLTADGMKVIRSFDLQSVRTAHVNCTCPHHGSDECNCQMVVLQVYDNIGTMLTVVAHGKDNSTNFALVKPPERILERKLKTKVLQAMALEGFSSLLRDQPNH
jgi:hypothetical protein